MCKPFFQEYFKKITRGDSLYFLSSALANEILNFHYRKKLGIFYYLKIIIIVSNRILVVRRLVELTSNQLGK